MDTETIKTKIVSSQKDVQTRSQLMALLYTWQDNFERKAVLTGCHETLNGLTAEHFELARKIVYGANDPVLFQFPALISVETNGYFQTLKIRWEARAGYRISPGDVRDRWVELEINGGADHPYRDKIVTGHKTATSAQMRITEDIEHQPTSPKLLEALRNLSRQAGREIQEMSVNA